MITKIKGYIIAILILIGLGTTIYIQHNTINSISREYKTASLNLKAYVDENSVLKLDTLKKSRVFQLTVNQFSQYSDSLLVKLDKYRKSIKVKDNQIQSLQYIQSHTTVDTFIKFKDSILVVGTKIDTIIRDNWFSMKMSLRYPDTIRVKPAFKNELFVAIHTTRETVEPPKKFFLWRWFQSKLTVVVADVLDKNPYTELGTLRFIQIVK